MQAVEAVSVRQKSMLLDKINHAFDGNLAGKVIAVWGVAFKPNKDDMRDAPSRMLMAYLWQVGATVQAFDTEAMNEARRIYGDHPDLRLVNSRDDAVIDGRNLYESEDLLGAGLGYFAVGRGETSELAKLYKEMK